MKLKSELISCFELSFAIVLIALVSSFSYHEIWVDLMGCKILNYNIKSYSTTSSGFI